MEYAKDISLNLKYNEENNTVGTHRTNFVIRCLLKVKKHRVLISIIVATVLMIIFDCFLIANFLKVLSTL